MADPNPYRQFARYYDLYVGDFCADLPLYRALCEPTHKVLEIGCGTGRVLFPLLQQGCTVTGVDTSPDMLRPAESKLSRWLAQGKLLLNNHDFCHAPLDEHFDRVLVTFFTFNYLLTATAQEQFLLHVHQSLAPGGILAMDLFYPQPLAQPSTNDQWQTALLPSGDAPVTLRQKRTMAGQIEQRIQIYTDGPRHDEIVTHRRYVTQADAFALLTHAGFQELQVTHNYSLAALCPLRPDEATHSPFLCLARRPA
jgi:SAM-dependent methyltransferase